jgi:hypothetical protein
VYKNTNATPFESFNKFYTMAEEFDFPHLAALYDDTLMATTSGYIRNYIHPAYPRPCREAMEIVDLTDDTEPTLHRMQCAVCSEFVESSQDLYPIVNCGVCNHGVCMECFDQVMTPIKAVTYYTRSWPEMGSWQLPLLRCPFCSSCVMEKRFYSDGVFYKTMEEASSYESLLAQRLAFLLVVRKSIEFNEEPEEFL